MSDKFLFHGASFLVLRGDGNTVLLSQRQNTGHEDGNYGLVSGHIERGETAEQTLIREVFEEANLDLSNSELKIVHVMQRQFPDRTYFDVYIEAEAWEGELSNKEPEKCSDLWFYAEDDLPANTIPYIAQALSCIRRGIPFSNYGFDNK
jgi:8-oxo-dGTP pyrophosphatase MutT (NUDIX family)